MLLPQRIAAAALLSLGLLTVPGVSAQTSAAAERPAFPTSFPLPDGFRPEGIAIGPGPFAYLGSLADGSIYRADLRTGKGAVVSRGPGTPTVGVKTDRRARLFASGGTAGNARVIDLRTGRILASYQLATGAGFVNDVVLTRRAAWFTDSANPVLYKLALGRGGALPATAQRLPLTGVVFGDGTNSNGIESTPDGKGLLVVQSNVGRLLRVDPASGRVRAVELGGETLAFGDGLLLRGRTLFVVQNRMNAIAVLRLNASGTSGRVVKRITDPRFDVPTTVAPFGHRLYLPNARFTTPPTPTTPYSVVAVSVR